ncbi:MAG: DUF3987 domain-containing protein [Oscillatoriaceae cyanobacterium Prado104]|nr:DUF3987 domain-containing protein [Oscillatoriaceae cyanobacterium Prado104]
MYSNDTSDFASKLVSASKTNPCPHCGKPDWCYSIGELSVCKRQSPPAIGWEITSKADSEGTPYYAPIQEKKAVRPAQTRYWEYPARDGSPLVRVKRIDFGDGHRDKKISQEHWDGKRWIPNLKDIDRTNIPIYRYAEVQKAIAENKLIFIAEGEPCADALRELGLTATTNIGGAEKWKSSDTSDLVGAQVAIVLDRDQPGLKRAALLSQEFPDALWLYPYPNSPIWNNPPVSDGLDVADWIASHKLTKEEILAAVGERKLAAPPTAKIYNFPKPEIPSPNLDNLAAEIDELLAADLKRSQLKIKFAGLAQKFRLSPNEVEKIYRDREQELEQEADREDVATEVARLLGSKSASLKLAEILPQTLAEPIDRLAKMMNLKPECYLLALLIQCGSLLKVGTGTMVCKKSDWESNTNYYGVLVAESSQKKSPVMRAIIDKPMAKLLDKSERQYEAALAAYESELASWSKDSGEPKPKEPAKKIYSFTEATIEGIAKQVSKLPEQAMLWVCDELAGTFKSANQYRGGRGGDEEKILEYWNGSRTATLRAGKEPVCVRNVGLSIFGAIQPGVLAGFLGDGSDSNGKFARFDFIHQPLAATKLRSMSGSVDLTPMLSALYEKLDSLPPRKFAIDPKAGELFEEFNDFCEEQRISHPKQGMRAMWGKAPEKVAKLVTILHCLHAAHNGTEISESVPIDTVRTAIKFVNFTIDQALSLNLELCDRTALAPNLAKIIALAERKGGTVSTREAQNNFPLKQRPTAQQIRELFGELSLMKYGEVTKTGKTISFVLTTTTMTTIASKQDTARVEDDYNDHSGLTTVTTVNEATVVNRSHTVVKGRLQSEPCPSKGLDAIVVTVVTNSPPLQNSEPLMMSCTTEVPSEPVLESVQNHPPLSEPEKVSSEGEGDIKVGDRVEIFGSTAKHYNGVTGTVIDVWYTSKGEEYAVEFDEIVGNLANLSSFPASEVRKLE